MNFSVASACAPGHHLSEMPGVLNPRQPPTAGVACRRLRHASEEARITGRRGRFARTTDNFFRSMASLARSATLAAGAALLLTACGSPEAPPEPQRPVLTQVVGEARTGEGASYSGEVRSRYETPLGFRVGGKITHRLVDAGAVVKAGDVLARLDPADTSLSAASAAAQLALAQAEATRFRELRRQNFVSQAALDAKETALKAARAQADLARNQSAYTVLKAEQPGVVALVAAEVGQVVAPGQTVFRVARPDTPEVAIAIPETRIEQLRTQQSAEISLWAEAEAHYKGILRELSPVADSATRTYAARVAILQPDARVRLGMTANVRFAGDGAEARPSVPLAALFQQEGKPAVWVVNADQTVALRPVAVLSYGEREAVLAGGVRPGERIVIAGVHMLTAGEKIRLAGQPAADAPVKPQ